MTVWRVMLVAEALTGGQRESLPLTALVPRGCNHWPHYRAVINARRRGYLAVTPASGRGPRTVSLTALGTEYIQSGYRAGRTYLTQDEDKLDAYDPWTYARAADWEVRRERAENHRAS